MKISCLDQSNSICMHVMLTECRILALMFLRLGFNILIQFPWLHHVEIWRFSNVSENNAVAIFGETVFCGGRGGGAFYVDLALGGMSEVNTWQDQ
jgi:hypothetical protein